METIYERWRQGKNDIQNARRYLESIRSTILKDSEKRERPKDQEILDRFLNKNS